MFYYYDCGEKKHFNYKKIINKQILKNPKWKKTNNINNVHFSLCPKTGNVTDYKIGWYKKKAYFSKKLCNKLYYPTSIIIKNGIVTYPLGNNNNIYPQINKWYFKPNASNGGNGIQILKTIHEGIHISKHNKNKNKIFVMQKAVDNINLINNRKYDMRMYTMMRVHNGIIDCFLYNNGYCRICINEYKKHYERNGNITNVGANWKQPNFSPETNICLYNELVHYNITFPRICNMITDVFDTIINDFKPKLKGFHGFVYMGFDIIIDEELMPHIIEVNNFMGYKMYNIHTNYTNMHDDMFKGILNIIIQPLIINKYNKQNDTQANDDWHWKYLKTFN